MTTLKFYWAWFRLGRAYWKARHLWTLLAWLDNVSESLASPARSVGDEMEAWLALQQKTNPEDDAA